MPLPIEARRPDGPTAWLQGKNDIGPQGGKRLEAPVNDPIPLPRGRRLVTLEDAGNYITRLPKAEHEAKEWHVAMEALILVAASGGPTMFARIGVMRALNHRKSDPAITPRRKRAKAIMR
jgi:hypothetical protein